MALKLIPLDEAARMLGISVDRLNQLRERQQIYGYRDGASWKFKEQDVERLADDLRMQTVDEPLSDDSSELADLPFDSLESDPLAATMADTGKVEDSGALEISALSESTPAPDDSIPLSDSDSVLPLAPEGEDVSEDVVLLSDRELGASEPGTSSTIIGKPGLQSPEESDIRLVGPQDRGKKKPGSDVKLAVDKKASESGLRLVVDPPLDVVPDAPTDLRLEDEDDLSMDVLSDSSADEIPLAGSGLGGKPAAPKDSAEIDLAPPDSDDEFAIAEFGSVGGTGDSGVTLAGQDFDDDDLVLSSAGGSDITLGSADSGISLASPSDSGLSLEEPLELQAHEEESLELGGDEFAIASDSDSDSADLAPAEDDFLLTPIEEALDADSEDSGSQVIALDSDSGFGDSGLLEAEGGGMLEEEFAPVEGGQSLGGAPMLAAAGAPMPGAMGREAPYSLWNVLSLTACSLILCLTGIMMFDLIRNMWSWDSPYGFNSTLMDTILGLFGS